MTKIVEMLYVGSEERGYVFKEYCRKNDITYDAISKSAYNIKDEKESIKDFEPKYLVLNIEQITNYEDEIVAEIDSIRQSSNSEVIIHAPGYMDEMEIIKSLTVIGINKYIMAITLGDMETEIEDCIKEKVKPIPEEIKEEIIESREMEFEVIRNDIPEIKSEEPTLINNDYDKIKKTVAIVGAMNRIGTTTIAVQLVKYLKSNGMNACYVERAPKGYTLSLVESMEVESHDKTISRVTFKNVEMYYDPKKINKLMTSNYEYYVYDYGNILDPETDIVSILEKDIVIAVVGADVGELQNTNLLLDKFYEEEKPFYLFNFVHPHNQNEVQGLMSQRKDRTYFSGYSPDPFTYSIENNKAFSNIILQAKKDHDNYTNTKDLKRSIYLGRK